MILPVHGFTLNKKKPNPNYTCTEWRLIILLTSSQTITISFVTDFIFFTLSTLCRAICIIEPVLTYCLKSHNSLNREKKITKQSNLRIDICMFSFNNITNTTNNRRCTNYLINYIQKESFQNVTIYEDFF